MLCMAVAAGTVARASAQENDKRFIFDLPTKADLEVTSFKVEGKFRSQGRILVTWSVRNASTVATPAAPWEDLLILSTTRQFTDGTELHSVPATKPLASTRGYTRTAEITLPRLVPSTYYLFVVVKTGREFGEANTDNNVMMWGPVSVKLLGDNTKPPLLELNRLHISRIAGNDVESDGSEQAPLRDLKEAISHAATYATATRKVQLLMGAGVYDEPVSIPDNVELKGSNPFDPGETVLRPSFNKMKSAGAGIVVEGDGASIRDLTIQMDPAAKAASVDMPLLQLQDAQATIDNIVIDGSGVKGVRGIESFSNGKSESTITRCVFQGLDTALMTVDSSPMLARNVFRDMAGPVIVVHPPGTKAISRIPNMGDIKDPTTGFNYFYNISGVIMENFTDQTLMAQMNHWGSIDLPDLGGLLNGPFETNPDIIALSFVSSVHVTVLDDSTGDPIYNAAVQQSPGIQPAFTHNVDGVYTYDLVPAGNYTFVADAPGYYSNDANVDVAPPNLIVSVTIRLTPDGTLAKSAGGKHNSDVDASGKIDFSELLRVVQLYNASSFRCLTGTEDGFAAGKGDTASCEPHAADFAPRNWRISLSELLRVIQLYQLGGYTACPDDDSSEDGFCLS
jgi:hypothetical protein